MPGLIDLQSDLKSLKYSSMPLGSDDPYVVKDINNPPSSNGVAMEVTARVDDLTRISKMFTKGPGLKYLANEALLQQEGLAKKLSDTQKQRSSLGGDIFQQVKQTAIGTAQLLASTLAQVPVDGTGIHFLRGLTPNTYLKPTQGNTFSSILQGFGINIVQGNTVEASILSSQGSVVSTTGVDSKLSGKESTSIYRYNAPLQPVDNDLKIKKNRATGSISLIGDITPKQSAQSGSSEIGGSPRTNKVQNTVSAYNGLLFPISIEEATRQGTKTTGSVGEPVNTATNILKRTPAPSVSDFRSGSLRTYSFNYNSPVVKKELRVNLGDQGTNSPNGKQKSLTSYMNIFSGSIDGINALEPGSKENGTKEARDLIKFNFEIITPDTGATVNLNTSTSTFLYFRAFLDSFNDDFAGTWEGRRYVGRAENFYTYGGFDRSINFSFKIAAATRSEMKPLYQKIVYLASATAPTYGAGGFMRGTLAKVTIGSYIYSMPGIIESVKYSWNKDYPWEIAMQNPETGVDDDMQELPMVLDCSVAFKPIHYFAPQTGLQHYITNPNPANGAKDFLT